MTCGGPPPGAGIVTAAVHRESETAFRRVP